MKKRSLGLLIALALLLPAALAQATTTTVMMYMCGTDLQSGTAAERGHEKSW